MIPTKTIEELILKHSSLEKDLSSGKIDNKIFAEKSNIPMIRRFIERFTDLLDLLEAQDDKRFTELFNEVSKWFGEHAELFLQESNLMLAKANDIRK